MVSSHIHASSEIKMLPTLAIWTSESLIVKLIQNFFKAILVHLEILTAFKLNKTLSFLVFKAKSTSSNWLCFWESLAPLEEIGLYIVNFLLICLWCYWGIWD